MKQFLAILIATFAFTISTSSLAATISFDGQSLDSIHSPLVCASHDGKKKKKVEEEEEEPECE